MSWLQDRHIDIAFEDIIKNECKNGENTLYFGPSIFHFIKLAPQKDIDAQLSQNIAAYKQHIVFIVNDCMGDLGSGESSHWSLFVYERASNTWYHMDLNNGYNEPHAKQIIGKVNNYLISIGSLLNSRKNTLNLAAHSKKMDMTVDHS